MKKARVVNEKPSPKILLLWLSGGASSALACKLALDKYKHLEPLLVRIDPLGEMEDNVRFCSDVAKYLGLELITISCKTYGKHLDCNTHLDLLEKMRVIRFPATGAPCTTILKKDVRKEFVKHLCKEKGVSEEEIMHVWGFDKNETHRFNRVVSNVKGHHVAPLIDNNLEKKDAIAFWLEQKIELPAAYKLGFPNANCIGCVKGGGGYWNLVREKFPHVFERAAQLERKIGFSILRKYFLDELPRDYGRNKPVFLPDCGSVGEGCMVEKHEEND